MLNPPALAAAITAVRPQSTVFAGIAFRSIHLRHFSDFSTAHPLFAAFSGRAGNRFVPPNGPAALYIALDADTAYREGNQAYYQLSATPAGRALITSGALRPDPAVLIGVHVSVSRLLDLRDPLIRLQLDIQAVLEILVPWKGVPNALTQLLGEAVFNDGHFEGICYPSAQNHGHDCLVLFPDRLQEDSWIDFRDPTTGLAERIS